jgi:hypothetical protein
MQTRDYRSGDVRDVGKHASADVFGDFADAIEINDPGIGRSTTDD